MGFLCSQANGPYPEVVPEKIPSGICAYVACALAKDIFAIECSRFGGLIPFLGLVESFMEGARWKW